jgi:hypothetical protein
VSSASLNIISPCLSELRLVREASVYSVFFGQRACSRLMFGRSCFSVCSHVSCPKLLHGFWLNIRGCIQKFPDWVNNEIYAYLWYYLLRSNTKGYGGKTDWTDSQNSDTTASSGRELYHLQLSLQAASPETFGYNLVHSTEKKFQMKGTDCDEIYFVSVCHGLPHPLMIRFWT